MKTNTYCEACKDNGYKRAVTHVAAQSGDGGKTVSWLFVCDNHAWGWNDGGDWDAPIIPLREVTKAYKAKQAGPRDLTRGRTVENG